MASWYMSYSHAGDHSVTFEPDHTGTSSTATDEIELRILNSGSPVPRRRDVLVALEKFKRWIISGGQNEGGTNLPIPS